MCLVFSSGCFFACSMPCMKTLLSELSGMAFFMSLYFSFPRNPKYKGYYIGSKVRIFDMFTKKQKFLPLYEQELKPVLMDVFKEADVNANELIERYLSMYRSLSQNSRSSRTPVPTSTRISPRSAACCGPPAMTR